MALTNFNTNRVFILHTAESGVQKHKNMLNNIIPAQNAYNKVFKTFKQD